MISEFALDPALVARWHDPKEWAFFREAFADGTGRVVSACPKKWRQDVVRAFFKQVPGVTDQSRQRRNLEAILEKLCRRMVERDSSYPDCPTWLEKAIAAHRERPFDGILSLTSDGRLPEVITPDMLFSESPPAAWSMPPVAATPRTAEAFAKAVSPLLRRCREAVFVDPWFDPTKVRFTEPLQAMLGELWGPESCVAAPSAQLVIAENGRSTSWLLGQCEKRLTVILPRGRSLLITVLRQRSGGEKIHNRYILTLLAGLSFGTGLDVADPDEAGQSDDLCRLSSEQLLHRWGQYVSARGSCFDIAAGPLSMSSSRR